MIFCGESIWEVEVARFIAMSAKEVPSIRRQAESNLDAVLVSEPSPDWAASQPRHKGKIFIK